MQDRLKTLIDQINKDSSIENINKDSSSLFSDLLDIAESDARSEDCTQALVMIEKIYSENNDSADIIAEFSPKLSAISEAAYEAGNSSACEAVERILAKSSSGETLNDVIASFDDPEYYSKIDDYLERMPYSRESVDDLLDAVTSWDLSQLYEKLLIDFSELLTDEEVDHLKKRYRQTFDLPLPEEESQASRCIATWRIKVLQECI